MSTRNFQAGDAYGITFPISVSTGALGNADSLPTASMYHNGSPDGTVTLTVASLSTGIYGITGTIPSGYAAGDRISVLVNATVGGLAIGSFVDHARLVNFPANAFPNAAAGATGGLPTGNAMGQVALASTQLFNNTGQTTAQPSNVTFVGGQAASATAPVAFPASIGTSVYAGGAVASVTAPVTVGTLPFTLAQIATQVLTDATSTDFNTANSLGAVAKSLNAMIASNAYTTAALAAAPTGGSAPSAATIAQAVLTDTADTGTANSLGHVMASLAAMINGSNQFTAPALSLAPTGGGTFPTNFGSLVIDTSGRVQVQPGAGTGQINLSGGNLAGPVPSVANLLIAPQGLATTGSTGTSIVLTNVTGMTVNGLYPGQKLMRKLNGEQRIINTCTISGTGSTATYTFTFLSGTGESGPFSSGDALTTSGSGQEIFFLMG